jgi:hypothetical protein
MKKLSKHTIHINYPSTSRNVVMRLPITRLLPSKIPSIASNARTIDRSFVVWRPRIRSIQQCSLQKSRNPINFAWKAQGRFYTLYPVSWTETYELCYSIYTKIHTIIHTTRDGLCALRQWNPIFLTQHSRAENLKKMGMKEEKKERRNNVGSVISLSSFNEHCATFFAKAAQFRGTCLQD